MPKRSDGPIVIGGSGGSGTRVVAQLLIESGVHLGRDLNHANDDLSFTFLFKHPKRFAPLARQEVPLRADLLFLFELHRHLLLGLKPLPRGSLPVLLRASWDHAMGRYSPRWSIKRLRQMRARAPRIGSAWGFKEPHTMYLLRGLARAYPDVKYIHVLRNGLDMVFSRHQQDFPTWGPHYGVDSTRGAPEDVFEFWYRSNRQVSRAGRELLGDRFLVVRLEQLCRDPRQAIDRILGHAGLSDLKVPRGALESLPRLPKTHARYLEHDTRWIDAEVLAKLAELGYTRNEDGWPVLLSASS